MQKLISIDFKSDFGFFRKPDANNTINLSYNILHKPALLGILGSIVGLEGYSQAKETENTQVIPKGEKRKSIFPEYYEKFKDLPIGIEPLNHEKGNFQKTVIKYSNTVGYANNGSTYLTEEATLIKPSYRVYLLLELGIEDQKKLYHCLKEGKTEYIPYFGKNEFPVWWDNDKVVEYEFEKVENINNSYKIVTIFEKKGIVSEQKEQVFDLFNFHKTISPYIYFERLPKGFNEELLQYELGEFVLTTFNLKAEYVPENMYLLKSEQVYAQLY
jgi:CRISPR-associated protein Cas5h